MKQHKQSNTAYYLMLAGVGVLAAALILFGALQYRIPAVVSSLWGFDPEGANQFAVGLLGHARHPMAPQTFLHDFRILLVLIYAAYAVMVAAAGRVKAIAYKPVFRVILAVSAALVLFFPLTLAMDAYTYLAYGHMGALHGLNPYLNAPPVLCPFHDPITEHFDMHAVTPSTYGPLWIAICYLVVFILHGAGLWWQAVAIKLIAAAALIGAALAGRQIAEHFAEGTGNRAMLAIGLNPLLLLEGPGSGHNDLLMVCALLMAIAFYLKKRVAAASLLLGVSIAVKLLPALLIPWLILDIARGTATDDGSGPRQGLRKWAIALLFAIGACLPLVLLIIPFWHGAATLTGLNSYTRVDLSAAEQAPIRAWLTGHHLGTHLTPLIASVLRQWPVVTIYLVFLLWLAERPDPKKWIIGWVSLTCLWPFFSNNLWFPWYFCWSWPVALVRRDRSHTLFSVLCGVLALIWSLLYTQPFVAMPLMDQIQAVLRALIASR